MSEYGLPDWFYRLSPLSMDAIKGPEGQYRAGARDMLTVVAELFTLIPKDVRDGSSVTTEDPERV